MSGKRAAPYVIDERTLEEKDSQPEQEKNRPANESADKDSRKIFKIKRTEDDLKPQASVNFKLNQSQQIKAANGEGPKQENKNPFENLFNNSSTSANNLFAISSNVNNGKGIFTNSQYITPSPSASAPTTTKPLSNLFTSNKGTEQSAQQVANSKPNIFASKSGINIFQNKPLINPSASLFNHNDDDGSGDSAQLEAGQEIKTDPSKSENNFKYEDQCPVLLTLKVLKYKKTGNELVQNVSVCLQKDKETDLKYLTVMLPQTKNRIYSGILLNQKTQFRHLNGKKQNVEVSAFEKEKQTLRKSILRFQFSKQEEGEQFFSRLEDLLGKPEEKKAETAKEPIKQEEGNKKE